MHLFWSLARAFGSLVRDVRRLLTATPDYGDWQTREAKRNKMGRWDLAALRVEESHHAILMKLAVPAFALLVFAACVWLGCFASDAYVPHDGALKPGEFWVGDFEGVVGLPDPGRVLKSGEALAGGLAAIGLWIGFKQWRDARREASLEKYYERLDLANRRMEAIYGLRRPGEGRLAAELDRRARRSEVIDVFGRGMSPEAMWIFTELDNLEYVLVKYELGYAAPEMVCRALDNFGSKCEGVRFFAESAEDLVGRGAGSGYLPLTQEIVCTFARDVPFRETAAAKEPVAPLAA